MVCFHPSRSSLWFDLAVNIVLSFSLRYFEIFFPEAHLSCDPNAWARGVGGVLTPGSIHNLPFISMAPPSHFRYLVPLAPPFLRVGRPPLKTLGILLRLKGVFFPFLEPCYFSSPTLWTN